MGKLFLLISFVLTFILIIRVIFPHDEETYRTAIFLIEHEEEEKFNKLNEWDLHPQQNIDLLDINLKVFILAELNSFILLGLNLIFFKIITYFFENFKSSSNSIVHENGKVSILKFFITSVIAIFPDFSNMILSKLTSFMAAGGIISGLFCSNSTNSSNSTTTTTTTSRTMLS